MSENQSPYTIQLLNDLHNHFPELLYNTQRFQSVNDVLQYIIYVANQSPYSNGRVMYTARQTMNSYYTDRRTDRIRGRMDAVEEKSRADAVEEKMSAPPSASRVTSSLNNLNGIRRNTLSSPSTQVRSRLSSTFSSNPTSIFPYSLSSFQSSSSNRSSVPSISEQILTGLFTSMLGGTDELTINLQNLEPVPIRPTAQQLSEHTTMHTSIRHYDDNCAICQDPIEEGQEVCTLNYCVHTFHQDCIRPWFENHVTCPTCRHDIRE